MTCSNTYRLGLPDQDQSTASLELGPNVGSTFMIYEITRPYNVTVMRRMLSVVDQFSTTQRNILKAVATGDNGAGMASRASVCC